MKFEPGDYRIVKVIDGLHKGRIGYYDDDDIILPEDETFDDNKSIYNERKNIERVAIVYFATFLLAPGYYSIPYDEIEYASMNDLMTRKDEFFNLCSPFLLKKKINHKELCSYFSELHLVETTLLEKIGEQRYVNKPTGFKIFISHSSKDKPFAKLLCMGFRSKWAYSLARRVEYNVGESIPEKISSGLQEADFIIIILSEDSVSSKWVEREWQIKYWNETEKGYINVLPILLKDCQIPELLRTKKYADFRTDFNQGLKYLLSALENLSRKL